VYGVNWAIAPFSLFKDSKVGLINDEHYVSDGRQIHFLWSSKEAALLSAFTQQLMKIAEVDSKVEKTPIPTLRY